MQILVKSYGCSTNHADGFALAGCLFQAGYKLVDSEEDADVVIYNTCAVKGPTENRVVDACKRLGRNKKLIVAGCLPLVNFERLQQAVQFDAVVGPGAGEQIVEIVRRVSNGDRVLALQGALESKPRLSLPRIQASQVVSVIPICYGCLGSCSYCCVVFARGRLRSYSVQEVVDRVREDVKRGFREFWLTAQDTGCYGRDNGTNLARLLEAVCGVEGDFKIRVGMMTPNMVKDILHELVEVFKSEKVFKFLHLPVQSGNDDVLRQMRRFYSVEDFRNIVGEVRKNFPMLSLATDIICGLPGEDEQAFQDTLGLIEEVKPDVVNVSKFYARPKTSAAKMKHVVSLAEAKRRSTIATTLARKIVFDKNKQWLGWKGKTLVDEIGKVSGSLIGRNPAYRPIVIKGTSDFLGKTINVKVVKVFPTYLAGEILE